MPAFGRDFLFLTRWQHVPRPAKCMQLPVDGLTFGCQTALKISSSHRKTSLFAYLCRREPTWSFFGMNLIAFHVCENKQTPREKDPGSIWRQNVLSCAFGHRGELYGFPDKQTHPQPLYWACGGISDFSRPRRLEGFEGFSHFFFVFVIQISLIM